MNILSAISDRNLFRPFFGEDLSSWKPWATALRCLYGLPIKSAKAKELIFQCTGRDATELPETGFQSALFLTGRRSGKSRTSAVIAGFEALFGGHEKKLAKGEVGTVAIISPTKEQSGIVWKALHAIFSTPLLKQEVVVEKEIEKILVLRNGIQIKILCGDWRTVRGYTLVCAIVDEVCFLALSEEFKVKSDSELVRALRPGLATTGGKLIGISSKYAKKGWAYGQWLRQHGCNKGVSPSFSQKWATLVWDAPSRVMNATLSQAVVDAAYLEDPAAARSEYGGEWRDDISAFVERTLVEALVAKGRKELLPRPGTDYFAFSDVSGGRSDAAALAIAHREGRKVILDFIRLWKAPHNPHQVVAEQADELKRFGLQRVEGDNFAAQFVAQSFTTCGIRYTKCELAKSLLYRELLPILCSAEIELLDNETLVDQIAGLERRTRSGGADSIDHAPGGHDDAANALAGVVVGLSKKKRRIGAIWNNEIESRAVGAV